MLVEFQTCETCAQRRACTGVRVCAHKHAAEQPYTALDFVRDAIHHGHIPPSLMQRGLKLLDNATQPGDLG